MKFKFLEANFKYIEWNYWMRIQLNWIQQLDYDFEFLKMRYNKLVENKGIENLFMNIMVLEEKNPLK